MESVLTRVFQRGASVSGRIPPYFPLLCCLIFLGIPATPAFADQPNKNSSNDSIKITVDARDILRRVVTSKVVLPTKPGAMTLHFPSSFMLVAASNKRATLITGSVMLGELYWPVRLLLCVPLQRELIALAAAGLAGLVDFAAYARLPERTVLTTANARIPGPTISTPRTGLLDRAIIASLVKRNTVAAPSVHLLNR